MNSTIEKFGYPHSLVREFEHWLVLLRPAQVTLGSLILAAKGEATAFGQLPAAAFAELGAVVAATESALTRFARYERINYLMLMMVDPHVHFHVIPRYPDARAWRALDFPDSGWPGVPDLKSAVQVDPEQMRDLKIEVESYF